MSPNDVWTGGVSSGFGQINDGIIFSLLIAIKDWERGVDAAPGRGVALNAEAKT